MAECRKPENADGLKASIFKALRSVELTIHGNEKRARVGGMRVAHVSPTRAATSNVFSSVPTRCDKRSGHNPSLSPRSGNHSAARHQSPLTTTNAKWSHLPQSECSNTGDSVVLRCKRIQQRAFFEKRVENTVAKAARNCKKSATLLQCLDDMSASVALALWLFQENGSCKSEPTVPRAFIEACTKGDIESVRELLKEKPDLISYASILCQKYSGLHYAAKGGHHDVVRLLLNSGADVNLRTSGYTALHLAAICKHTKVIEVLLKEYRADCNIVDLSGRTFDYYAGSLMSDVWRTKRDGDGDKSCFQLRCFSCNADESYTGVTEVPQQQAQTHTSAGFVNSN
ncbi:Ankyrin repeat domain-containing protein SOWAHC [Toxocara canis]|uniref:Ankyrin repeat domain-containing protein SOWAHC n=1 Tax=Toxocara canis TaxID=6265 RepID=A0A0B2V8M6_TOXCA|nr:Ankyrin repeat domain-containing protein SOWAHC [Toxocara canis]